MKRPTSKPRDERSESRGYVVQRLLVLAAALLAALLAAPSAVHPEPTPAEIDANRRRLAELQQQHPEKLQKLRAEAAAFFALPEQRRQQIAEIDEALARQPRTVQRRLTDVLDRYTRWLDSLDETSRKRLAAAPDRKSRLAVIRELREQEWIQNQPQAIQSELQKLQGDAYAKRLAELKQQERQRKLEWTIASRFWNELETKRLPTTIDELPQSGREPMREYVRDYLLPALSAEDKDRLEKAKGRWPDFPMTLVALAAKHPPALPGPRGPTSLKEVPQDIRVMLLKDQPIRLKKDFELFAKAHKLKDGTWPEFGTRLANHAKSRGLVFPHEFLAYNEDCLGPALKQFLNKTLLPALDGDEKVLLANSILKWPEYPATIQALAQAHGLEPPWYTLPRQEYWDKYRLDVAGR
jgi:hypothetical protein